MELVEKTAAELGTTEGADVAGFALNVTERGSFAAFLEQLSAPTSHRVRWSSSGSKQHLRRREEVVGRGYWVARKRIRLKGRRSRAYSGAGRIPICVINVAKSQ